MKTLSQCFFVILLLTLMLGCKKENNPVLSTESLPQGFAVNNDFSTFNSVTALSNGEIVIAGTLKEGKKLGLLKLDKDCNEIWSKSYFDVDYLNTVKVVKQRNDDLIITGTLDSNTSIASLDKDGNEIWCHKNILEVGIEGINPIQTMDNGILVAVTVDTGFVNVVKYDDLGEELWSKSYGGDAFILRNFYPIETDNGNIIIPFNPFVASNKDLAYLKINSEGEELWIRDIELPIVGIHPNLKTIKTKGAELLTIITSFRGFNSFPANKAVISKIDLNVSAIWEKTINIGTTNSASSILELSTTDIIFLGTVGSMLPDDKRETVLIKMDSQGNEIWRKTYEAEQHFRANDLIETTEGFLIVGSLSPLDDNFNSTATILKVDKEGNPL